MATNRAALEPLRSLAAASISGTYAAVGTAIEHPCRLFCLSNDTEGNMIFSIDGINDHLFVAAGSFKLFDVTTNHRPTNVDDLAFPVGTIFYVKQLEAPVTGSVYVEIMYAAE